MTEPYRRKALEDLSKDELVSKTQDFLRDLYQAKGSVKSPGGADDIETPTAAERYFDLCEVLGLKMMEGMLPDLAGCHRNLLAFTVGCALLDDYYCNFFNEREIQIELLEKDDPKSLYARGWIGPDEYEVLTQGKQADPEAESQAQPVDPQPLVESRPQSEIDG